MWRRRRVVGKNADGRIDECGITDPTSWFADRSGRVTDGGHITNRGGRDAVAAGADTRASAAHDGARAADDRAATDHRPASASADERAAAAASWNRDHDQRCELNLQPTQRDEQGGRGDYDNLQ